MGVCRDSRNCCENIACLMLKFRGREMAHKEFGFQQIEKFTREVAPYGHPDNQARLAGRAITVMFSPLPRNKRAKNPRVPEFEEGAEPSADAASDDSPRPDSEAPSNAGAPPAGGFSNNPFSGIDLNPGP